MRIECPGCKLTGNIDDSRVPATGLAMTCPRCKKQFTAELAPQGSEIATAMLDTCPSCQYATFSEEKFAVCPQCGLDVAEYQKKLLESRNSGAARHNGQTARKLQEVPPPAARMSEEQRRKDEEARRKFGLDKPPGTSENEEPVVMHHSMAAPLSVMIAGWGTIIVALLLLVYSGAGIIEYNAKLEEAAAAIAANETPQTPATLFFGYLFAPSLFIGYALVMTVIGAQFLRLKKRFVRPLEIGAWVGISLVIITKLSEIWLWFGRASSSAALSYYAMGVVGDVLMALLWITPFFALAEYLKSPLFEKVEDLFM